jgi:hypothetical protein
MLTDHRKMVQVGQDKMVVRRTPRSMEADPIVITDTCP